MAGRIWRTAGVVAAMGLILGGVVRAQTGMPTSAQGLDQGWDASQKQIWYSTSQGSRLIPYAWLTKLEAPEGGGRFLDDAYFSRFHYLPGPAQPDGTRLPAGFVLDTTPDAKLTRTALRWTANQGDGAPWVGMNCSACHTGQVVYHNPTTQAVTALTVEGGPTGADFQGFIGALDAALNLTLTNADRFDRFAQGVLGSAYPADKDRLRTALAALVARQNETARQNQLPGGYHYGYGRLDAIGNIYNKVQIAATPTPTPSPPNAPVSYPFLWNVPQHDKVQWDGIAPNDNQALLPLLRNGGEVIGVFGDIELKGPDVLTFPSAYRSSLNARGLMALEAQLHWLKPPRWPDEVFGAPDKALVNDGLRAYARNCVGCHSLLPGGREDLHSQIKAQMSDLPSAGTDIGMACNAFTRRARSGVLAGTRYSANSRLQDEAFVSDTWRLSHAVTMEYGLRVQYHQPTYTQANNMASFDPSLYDPAQAMTVLPNGTLVPGSGNRFDGMVRPCGGVPDSELARVPNGRDPAVLAVPASAPCGFYPSQTDAAPRLSVAWTPDSGRTSIRGGAGLFIDRPEGNLYFPLVNNAPYSLSSQYENGNLAAPDGGTAAALAPLASMDAIIPDLKLPRTWQYSATVQRELPFGIFAEIGYVGSTGKNLIRQPDINQPSFAALEANAALPSAQRLNTNALRPYKGYSNIRMRLSDADSRYNALQTYLAKRRGRIKWTQSYTLGSSKDNASGNGDNPEDYLDKNYNWGPSSFDRRHILVETWTWDVPFLHDRGDLLGAVLGDWEISGIYRYQSGAPLTISGNTAIGTRRADYLGGDAYVPDAQRTNANGAIVWLDASQFAAAPETRLGNSLRGQFRGPAYQVFDLSFRKAIPLPRHGSAVKFQADLFNALNQVDFGDPATTVTSGNFGQITSVSPPRNIQLGLRIEF